MCPELRLTPMQDVRVQVRQPHACVHAFVHTHLRALLHLTTRGVTWDRNKLPVRKKIIRGHVTHAAFAAPLHNVLLNLFVQKVGPLYK